MHDPAAQRIKFAPRYAGVEPLASREFCVIHTPAALRMSDSRRRKRLDTVQLLIAGHEVGHGSLVVQ